PLLLGKDLESQHQSCRKRRLAANRDFGQGFLGKHNGVGGRQHQDRPVFLEDDQPDAIPALVGIRQQGHDRAFGGVHAFGNGHAPRRIDHEQDQVGGTLHPDFALQVLVLNGVGHPLMFSAALEGRGSAEGSVEGDVISPVASGPGLDVPATFALGARLAAAPTVFARQPIQRRVQPARREFRRRLDLFPALPPVGGTVVEDRLRRGFGVAQVGRFFGLFRGYGLTFFLAEDSSPDGVVWALSPSYSLWICSTRSSRSATLTCASWKGPRFRRCGSASSAASIMSRSLICWRPCSAACARAAFKITRSARCPSMCRLLVRLAMVNRSRSVYSTSSTISRAVAISRLKDCSLLNHSARNFSGSSS